MNKRVAMDDSIKIRLTKAKKLQWMAYCKREKIDSSAFLRSSIDQALIAAGERLNE